MEKEMFMGCQLGQWVNNRSLFDKDMLDKLVIDPKRVKEILDRPHKPIQYFEDEFGKITYLDRGDHFLVLKFEIN